MKTSCPDCSHVDGQCDCWCCGSLGCPSCAVPVLIYRGVKKLVRKSRKQKPTKSQ